jgi:hypothetical protein
MSNYIEMHDASAKRDLKKLCELVVDLIDSDGITPGRVLKAATNISLGDDDDSQALLMGVISMLKDGNLDPEGKGLQATRQALTLLLDDESY